MVTSATAVFPFRIGPINNIQPFTYRDGMSHLQLLEKLRVYINDNLRGEFNDELNRIITEVNEGMEVQETQFNTAFADFVLEINDTVMAINNRVGPEGVQHITLTEDYLIEIDPVWPDNQHLMFDLVQDATGGRVVTLGSGITGPLALDPAPNARTVFTIVPLSNGTWRIESNSYTDTLASVSLAGKLNTTDAVSTYLAQTDAAEIYKTVADADDERATDQALNLSKAGAAVLYPTKQAVINGQSPDKRTLIRGGKTAFIGDSYISGVGPSSPANKWASLYASYAGFVESNHAVSSSGYHNEGVGGASRFAVQAGNIPLDTTRVIVCGGINDTSFTPTQIANGVQETISAIQTRVPNAEIVVISPMWPSSQPSDGLLLTERIIRNNIPDGVRYVEGGPWLRQGRPDTANGADGGHPNDLGSKLIARWVQAKLDNAGPGGALEGSFERTAINEDESVVSSGAGVGLAGGTVYDARPGKWRLITNIAAYGTSDGFLWNSIAGQRQVRHWGINTAGVYPTNVQIVDEVRHPGGDLVIEGGITMNAAINVLETGTNIKADWISD